MYIFSQIKTDTVFLLGMTAIPKSWKMKLIKPEFKNRGH
jgi:hypothetical protein